MRLVNVATLNKAPEDIKSLLLKSGVIPATSVGTKTWEAINAVDENGKRKYRYIIEEGSSRSSKTISLIDCYDLLARAQSNKRMTVWRDTKTDCKKTILNDTLKHLRKTRRYKVDQEFNKTESIFTYKNGSSFEIHGCDDEETVHGLSQDVAWFNEPYKITKDVFDQIDQRTADVILVDWNPKKAHFIDDLKKDPRAIVIHSTFKDNPFCPEEERVKILSYQPLKMCEVATLITEQEARVYDVVKNEKNFNNEQIEELSRCRENEEKKSADVFKWQVYGLGLKSERPNRIFKWEEIPDHIYKNLEAKIYYGVDWGTVDPWGIVEAKYYDGALYLHEKNYLSENKIREKLTPVELQQISNQEEGIVTFMFNKLSIDKKSVVVCDNNRLLKIAALRRAGWSAIPAMKTPGSVIDGIDLLSNLKIYFTSSSTNLKYEQENYSREIDRYGIVLEEPEDTVNHIIDPVRYIGLYLQYIGIIKKI
jgi:phage terminase large subunit